MNKLIEWLMTSNASPETVRSLLADQGTDIDALRAEATERLDQMRATVDTDPAVTAEAVQAVKTIIAAVTPIEDTGDTDPDTGQDDTADDSDDSESDEAETGDAVENTDTAIDATPETTEDTTNNDGGGAVNTLDNNQDPNASVTEPAPVEGDVIPAEAFKAKSAGTVQLTMNQPGVAARFTNAKASNPEYQVFAGEKGRELETAGDVADHVGSQLSLLRQSRFTSSIGVPVLEYKPKPGAMKFHRYNNMQVNDVQSMVDEAVFEHSKMELFTEANPTWCAPALQHYEFCPVPRAWGLFGQALPIIASDRGSNSWPTSPDLGQIWGQGMECRTAEEEAQRAEEGTPKACTPIGCPEWIDYIDEICHLCVTVPTLQHKAFPEYTDQVIRTYELMYETMINWNMLQKAIAIADQQNGEIRWNTAGWGITAAVKHAVNFAIDSLSAKHHLNPTETQWNMAVPFWMYSVIQLDLQKRVNADIEMMSIGRDRIDLVLKGGRTLRIWQIMPWQQALTETEIPDPAMRTWLGGGVSIQNGTYADTMEILIWPQGALVGVRDDFLSIRGRWDYGLQRQNQQLELFNESQWNVIPRCYSAMHITLDICSAGRSGSLFEYPCGPEAPAEELAGV